MLNPKSEVFHLTDLIEASLVEPRESVLHGGKPVGRANRVRVVQLLVQLVRCHHVVVAGGGGGEAVRGADGVGGALGGEARHRPQAGHHGVRLLERPQRVSDLRKLFSPVKKNSLTDSYNPHTSDASFLLDSALLGSLL